MFCRYCGKQLTDGAKFCSGCGSRLDQPADAPEVSAAEEAAVQAASTPVAEPIMTAEATAPAQTAEASGEAREQAAVVAEITAPEPVQAAEMTVPVQQTELPEAVETVSAAAPKKKKKTGLIVGLVSVAAVLAGGAALGYFCFSNQISRLFMGDAMFAASLEGKTFAVPDADVSGMDSYIAYGIGAAASSDTFNEKASGADADVLYGSDSGSVSGAAAPEEESLPVKADDIYRMISGAGDMMKKYDNTEIRSGISLEIDGVLREMLGTAEIDLNEVFSLINGAETVSTLRSGDGCRSMESAIELDGRRLVSANVYLNSEYAAVTAPGITGYTFFAKAPGLPAGTEMTAFSADEVTRIRKKIAEMFREKFNEADITYEDGEYTVAGSGVKGTRVRVVMSGEVLKSYVQEVADFLKNDEYVSNYYVTVTGMDKSEYEKGFDRVNELKPEKCELELISYIAAHSEILAKEYSINGTDKDTEGQRISLAFVKTDNGGANAVFNTVDPKESRNNVSVTVNYGRSEGGRTLDIGIDGKGALNVTADETKDDGGRLSGTAEITLTAEKLPEPVKLTLTYSGVEMSEFRGDPVVLGSCKLKISENDRFFDKLLEKNGISSDDGPAADIGDQSFAGVARELIKKIELSFSAQRAADNGIRSETGLNIPGYVSFSAYIEVRPIEGGSVVMPDINGDKCVDLGKKPDEELASAIGADFYENLLGTIKSNDKLAKLCGSLRITETLENNIEKEKRSREYKKHYADYYEGLTMAACIEADGQRGAYQDMFINWYTNAGKDELSRFPKINTRDEDIVTVKYYFDENSNVNVIDDGGYDFIRFSGLGPGHANMYCEVFVRAYGTNGVVGATTVFTDDVNDLPPGLPTAYNFLDGKYEWNGDMNRKDGFVVGVSPYLEDGASDYEQRMKDKRDMLKNVSRDAETLNGYAKRLSEACGEYLNGEIEADNSILGYYAVDISYNGGEWTVDDIRVYGAGGCLDAFPEDCVYRNGGLAGMLNGDNSLSFEDGIYAELFVAVDRFSGAVMIRRDDDDDPQFGGYGFPYSFDDAVKEGVFFDWAANNYEEDAVPGQLWINGRLCVPVGSWCVSTNAPLAARFSDYATLDLLARDALEAARHYFEDGCEQFSDSESYMIAMVRMLYSVYDESLDGGEWMMLGTVVNGEESAGYDENAAQELTDALKEVMPENYGYDEGLFLMIYMKDGAPTGAFIGDEAGLQGIASFDDVPAPEEIESGAAERVFGFGFGSWCASTSAPLETY